MIKKAQHWGQLWRYLGPGWLLGRAAYSARLRSGLLRRQLPATTWEARPLSSFLSDPALADPQRYLEHRRKEAPKFFFDPARRAEYSAYFADWDGQAAGEGPLLLSRELAEGSLRYFEHTSAHTGFPPDWHANPFTGQRAPAGLHWSQIGNYSCGDIKIIWEPSRFGAAYVLARAYWRTGDNSYAEMFWRMLEDWRAHNPPQSGPNWMCGQETSFRVMAWCFGLYAFLDAPATSGERVADLAEMVAVSGERIEANLEYALSQRNNHGISEGLGLWTVGALFPELRKAAEWREKGREILESQGRELIYDDGAFVQHSANYQRLMLHDYLWALRLGDIHEQPFSLELKARVGRAGAFLYQMQDEESGGVPYYGQNDGALVLPLNNCDYRDFRSVVGAVHYYCHGTRLYEDGPWNEDLLWLFGPQALDAPTNAPQRADFGAPVGGNYTLRAQGGFAAMRCATFKDRPGQADMLHVDVWWQGQNMAADAGTYSYSALPPWDNPLAHTAYHNTVTVDGLDQMDRAGKFLWLPWLRSRVRCHERSEEGHLAYWEGEHNGYKRLREPAGHRRGVLRLGDGMWLILDALWSRGSHDYKLHWLFPDVPYSWEEAAGRLALSTPVGPYYAQMTTLQGGGARSLVRADACSPRGWRAPYYNYREPALSVDLAARGSALIFWTLLGPEPCSVSVQGEEMTLEAERWMGTVRLGVKQSRHGLHGLHGLLVDHVALSGKVEDRLEPSLCASS